MCGTQDAAHTNKANSRNCMHCNKTDNDHASVVRGVDFNMFWKRWKIQHFTPCVRRDQHWSTGPLLHAACSHCQTVEKSEECCRNICEQHRRVVDVCAHCRDTATVAEGSPLLSVRRPTGVSPTFAVWYAHTTSLRLSRLMDFLACFDTAIVKSVLR